MKPPQLPENGKRNLKKEKGQLANGTKQMQITVFRRGRKAGKHMGTSPTIARSAQRRLTDLRHGQGALEQLSNFDELRR